MTNSTRGLILSALLLAAASPAVAQTGDGDRSTRAPSAAPVPSWSGDWDIIGTGFDEGARFATLTVARRDSTCVCTVLGPPGRMLASLFKDDSLHIVWEFSPDEHMLVDLALENGALAGVWRINGKAGDIVGVRRSP